ncbi:MAG: rubrerythrin family protein [Candidatus Hodarchaeota archaeon]
MAKTEENLKAAFAGESQANRKYLAFAKRADQEGFPQIARLFRAVAEAETVHAHAHLRTLKGVKSTAENIKAAIEGEHYEFTQMYPEFLKAAQVEGEKAAERSFNYANEVEKIHHELYNQALKAATEGKDLAESKIYVCGVCGHTHIGGEAPENCPICNASQKAYILIE